MTEHHALVGQGISHSLSPRLWTAVFDLLEMDADYGTCDLPEHLLGDVLSDLRAGTLTSVHVTMPYKQWAHGVVDEHDQESVRWTGVVNSIRTVDGRLIGQNTDLASASIALRSLDDQPRRALVVGAGATAASLAGALLAARTEVYVTNRTDQRAVELAARAADSRLIAVPWHERCDVSADLVVNTAPFGLRTSDSPFGVWPADASALYDLIYASELTALQRQAVDAGAVVWDGLAHLQGHVEVTLEQWLGSRSTSVYVSELISRIAGRRPLRWDRPARL